MNIIKIWIIQEHKWKEALKLKGKQVWSDVEQIQRMQSVVRRHYKLQGTRVVAAPQEFSQDWTFVIHNINVPDKVFNKWAIMKPSEEDAKQRNLGGKSENDSKRCNKLHVE